MSVDYSYDESMMRDAGSRIMFLLRICETAFHELLVHCTERIDEKKRVLWTLHHVGLCKETDEDLVSGNIDEVKSREFLDRVIATAQIHHNRSQGSSRDANFGETIDTFGKLCAKPQIFEGSLVKFPIDVVVDRSDTRAVPQLDVVRDELEKEMSETQEKLSGLKELGTNTVESRKELLGSLSSSLHNLSILFEQFIIVFEQKFEPFLNRAAVEVSTIGKAAHSVTSHLHTFHGIVQGVAEIHKHIESIGRVREELDSTLQLPQNGVISHENIESLEKSISILQNSIERKLRHAELGDFVRHSLRAF